MLAGASLKQESRWYQVVPLHRTHGDWTRQITMGRGQHMPPTHPHTPTSPSPCPPTTQPVTSELQLMAGGPGAIAGYLGQVGGHSHDIHSGGVAARKGQQTPGKEPSNCRSQNSGAPEFASPFPFLGHGQRSPSSSPSLLTFLRLSKLM